jgi:nicotinate-nucleotide adenylyltransferase
VCAQEAYWQIGLDRVWLMPANVAPHKEMEDDPGPEERVALCAAAVEGAGWLEASRVEVERPGPSYTVDTLRGLSGERPQDEFVLLLGADRAATLPQWREPVEILRIASVAVTQRDGMEEESVREALSGLDGGDRVTAFEMPRIDISSTLVRERGASGRPYRFLVPDAVAERIDKQGLYRGREK